MEAETVGVEALSESDFTDLIRRTVESMAFQPSEREVATYAEVIALPRVVVTRPPVEDLLAAGFVHYDCHRNCGDQAVNDPKGESRHVVGWLPYGDDLILHSVAEIGGRWFCLTPQIVPTPNNFEFIPDPHLEWQDREDGAARTAFRDGHEVPEALRKDPYRHIRIRDEFLAMLETGMSAIEARDAVAKNNRPR